MPSDIVSPVRSSFAAELYDHEISLVDTTNPPTEATDSPRSSADLPTASKRSTRGTLREELTRRKYARFQEARYKDDNGPASSSNDESQGESSRKGEGGRRGRLRDKFRLKSKKGIKSTKKEEYEVDVLYENQRGWFFCGIPLYSSKSLLNFDPSPWQTVHFKDSPVDITNAQVPDPTWVWVWKSWYVDMSHDVDEEGWEYSFSFHQGFSWHGTHPWFHSFVRRRRWLRKRVKLYSRAHHESQGTMSEAHRLNQDYFTIHPSQRDRSRDSNPESATNNRSSYLSKRSAGTESDSEDEEIADVTTLIRRLKKTTIDRKKVDAFKSFLRNGGDEVYYLQEAMPEIMSLFLYPTSRRYALQALENTYERMPESDRKESKRAEGLEKAIAAVDETVRDLEYWSDKKVLIDKRKDIDTPDGSTEEETSQRPLEEFDPNDINVQISTTKIKGIPEKAGIGVEPGILRPLGYMLEDENEKEGGSTTKGKERA